MATLDGISVRIVANGDSLPFYGGPAAENEPSAADTRTRNYYVEAVDGASFALELRATEDWEARAGNGLVFTFSFDGGAGFVMPMAVAERRGRGEVVVGNGVRGVPAYDGAEGEWRRVGLGFGRLDTVEGDGGGGGGFAGDVRELGTIRVSARRAVLRKFKTYAVGGREGWRGVGRVSERDLKGMAVTNAVTFTAGDRIEWPMHSFKETRIAGADGLSVNFNIFYRSRDVLEMLGCKPMISAAGLEQNTAISGPEVKVTPFSKLGAPRVLINPFAKLDPQFEEIQQLRARLAILEKNASIKVEPLGMVTSPVRERVGIKREPLEPEDRRECKRLRSSRYGGFVDLT